MATRRGLRRAVGLCATVGLLSAASPAHAEFQPTWEITPSTRDAGANPRVDFRFVQAAGEEALDRVTVLLPRRYRLPPDGAIAAGEHLGQGKLMTATAPLCSEASQQSFDATLYERDRTADEVAQGIWAVWVADLGPVDVEFLWSRFPSGRWRMFADVPNNPIVCPPVTLTSTINQTSSESATKLVRNPRRPGVYTLKSVLVGISGSEYVVKDRIRLKAPPGASRDEPSTLRPAREP